MPAGRAELEALLVLAVEVPVSALAFARGVSEELAAGVPVPVVGVFVQSRTYVASTVRGWLPVTVPRTPT